jgi:hypothetical protein
MDYQRPDPEGRIEDDFIRPVTPAKNASRRRLPAALPIAIAGLLVVSSVAFGATVVYQFVAQRTPVVLEDEPDPGTVPTAEPTAEPTVEPTAEPTVAPTPTPEPSPVEMTLTAKLSGGKVVLTWSGFKGDDFAYYAAFAYYKVVRSTDEVVSWPIGENDTVVAAISDPSQLTLTDAAPVGSTYSYRVFAVNSSTEGYGVIGLTNVVTIAVPKPTPNCTMSLSATLVDVSYDARPNVVAVPTKAVKLTWTKYRCDYFEAYLVLRSTTNSKPNAPLPYDGTEARIEIGSVSTLTWTDTEVVSGQTYYFRVVAWNSKVFCDGGTVLARTNVVKVVIP